ncbi:Serine/threonine-protein kinase/endoribonuclease ire-1 [Chionoecetes opilio]|uniref:non-specific serine/threonine protein kinase n=1 Tax=Chionoecetes opilio TaxID=41210 RepID=A0A8J4Y3G7_CHIOP|nr:Serine/threonine-protein kinase/endoribonuclease ire-1 [Chionoecetes opilio]
MKADVRAWRCWVVVVVVALSHTAAVHHRNADIKNKITTTELLAESEEGTLLVSTLDGALHAIAKSSGALKWTLKDDPIILNPTDSSQPPLPQFFPNPQDGSLYRYTLGRGRDPLKKLPFTIPQLVANSPCRSSDGIFYLGKKVDSWVGIDSLTGEKQLLLGVDVVDRKCPKPSRNTVYFGRTLYNIILYEGATGNKWNISFSEYATSTSSATVENYDLVHYTSTGEGSILTVDQRTGSLLWTLEMESPLVAMYLLGPDGGLLTVPITTVAPQTLVHFTREFMHLTQHSSDGSEGLLIKKLSPTIYIGECSSGVYAVPALVDVNTATISHRGSRLLLGGPPGTQGTLKSQQSRPASDAEEEKNPEVLLLGYYDIPESVQTELVKTAPGEIGDEVIRLGITHEKNDSDRSTQDAATHRQDLLAVVWGGMEQMKRLNVSFVTTGDMLVWLGTIGRLVYLWGVADYVNLLMVILTCGFVAIMIILYKQAQEYARLSQEMSSRRQGSQGSAGSGSPGSITAVAEELHDGSISVGKIIFNPQKLLGKGCDGTFVFRGTFDGRAVAVKRVLPDCFSIANREVDLLRESDQHPSVIRYFCTEQCRQFRYIALELCSATLEDFIQGRFKADISIQSILHQATSGLHHLHLLDIVHRDIKPHNVLLSLPDSRGQVRAMLSDFGLCKRLETGHMSFSKRSGVTGTEGWIAPEMMLNTSRPTFKVDIFSLGCVYYYMLTRGRHPFGSVLDRQSNIISGKFRLDDLDSQKDMSSTALIERMVSGKPSERPPTHAILKHPFFWNDEKVLTFFLDVSDRTEKESGDAVVVVSLERGGVEVVRGDWKLHMHPVIEKDLRRFRDYKGRSVRDLLRALRNKRNHYRELNEDARMVFGRIPDEYVSYWTSRFPRLLLHTWYAMQCVKTEIIFHKYYDDTFNFGLVDGIESDQAEELAAKDFTYENVAFAPQSPVWPVGTDGQEVPAQRGTGTKTATNSPHKEKQEETNPVWIIRKPANTFEPKYRIPKLRNLDGPWRRPVAEANTKQALADNAAIPVQEVEVSVLGNEPEIKNATGPEETSRVSEVSESSEGSCEGEKTSQETSETQDETEDSAEGIQSGEPSEGFEVGGEEGSECPQELPEGKSAQMVPESKREVSPVLVRSSTTPGKSCEPDHEGKFAGKSCEPDHEGKFAGKSCEPDHEGKFAGKSCEPDHEGKFAGKSCEPDHEEKFAGKSCEPDHEGKFAGKSCEPDHEGKFAGKSCEPDHEGKFAGKSCEPDHEGKFAGKSCEPDHEGKFAGKSCEPDHEGKFAGKSCEPDHEVKFIAASGKKKKKGKIKENQRKELKET